MRLPSVLCAVNVLLYNSKLVQVARRLGKIPGEFLWLFQALREDFTVLVFMGLDSHETVR